MTTIWKFLADLGHRLFMNNARTGENETVLPKPQETPEEVDERLEREREAWEDLLDPEGHDRLTEDTGREVDAYADDPPDVPAEQIEETIDRQMQGYVAESERIVGFAEISRSRDLSGNLMVASAKVVRREHRQVVEIKLGGLFLRVCAHSKQDVELPSLRQICPRGFEVCVPSIVLGVPPVPTQPHRVDTDPADICHFIGSTKAQWSADTTMIVSVCRDEASIYGVCLRIQTYGQDLGATKVKLRSVGGWSQFPTLRTGGGGDSLEVDIARLVLEPSEDG